MPIPKPTPSEKKNGKKGEDAYIGRCMSILKDEFPDQKQRAAICFQTLRDSKRKSTGTFDHLETDKIEILD